jgi:hypothetical protein
MGDGLTLSKQDEQLAIVLGRVGLRILGIAEAAALIGVSERQVRRLSAAYQREGPRGIVHGNRGQAARTSPLRMASTWRLYTAQCRGRTPTATARGYERAG